jgi:hypothetical protein
MRKAGRSGSDRQAISNALNTLDYVNAKSTLPADSDLLHTKFQKK